MPCTQMHYQRLPKPASNPQFSRQIGHPSFRLITHVEKKEFKSANNRMLNPAQDGHCLRMAAEEDNAVILYI